MWVSRFMGTKFPWVLVSGIGALLIGIGAVTIARCTYAGFFLGQAFVEMGLGIEPGTAMVWIQDMVLSSLRRVACQR
ncbi:MAG: hypothetical protein C7B47_06120 [Sulfobacillus thermosulfidooxidans]|uniref:Uncharacterized protein n=1 Tax=Sulfobacillus thermosulfidooxidans TaxID=28034 RepID=A0A2T2X1B3_SULTH|nr:MAG: hypothetical protein C7B47_06120 [Sulfobacillus thermosulfidooxidans]